MKRGTAFGALLALALLSACQAISTEPAAPSKSTTQEPVPQSVPQSTASPDTASRGGPVIGTGN